MQPDDGAGDAPKVIIEEISLTPGAIRLPPEEIEDAVRRHERGEWGDVDEGTAKANDEALRAGWPRVVSAFRSASSGARLLVVTEEGEIGRLVTHVLLESEACADPGE
jgi:hypothetical protein